MNDEFKIDGLKEVEEALTALPAQMQAGILRSFNREAAAKFTKPALKSANPFSDETGKGFIVKADRDDKTAVFVGASSDSYWLRFMEYGTKERVTKAGKRRGRVNARPFIETAIDSTVDNIINYANDKYGERIQVFLERKLRSINKRLAKI